MAAVDPVRGDHKLQTNRAGEFVWALSIEVVRCQARVHLQVNIIIKFSSSYDSL